jgi:hypothetical protein
MTVPASDRHGHCEPPFGKLTEGLKGEKAQIGKNS